MLILDAPASGGVRVANERVTLDGVLAELRSDPRLPALESRCRLYYEFINHPFGANQRLGRLTQQDYPRVEDGACAREFPLAQFQRRALAPPPGTVFRDCEQCPQLTVIPAGSYRMGNEHPEPDDDAKPAHWVALARPFATGVFEVTRADFARFVTATGHESGRTCHDYRGGGWRDIDGRSWRDPGYEQSGDHPVACVSWFDAQSYVDWLSRETGHRYRLPSESEWEYLAVTGRASADGQVRTLGQDDANQGAVECCGPARGARDAWEYTAPVGSFPPDALGLHDVAGNLWEWLADCYHADYIGSPADGRARTTGCSEPDRRVVRGGAWGDAARIHEPDYRLRAPADQRYFTLGFRVARDLD